MTNRSLSLLLALCLFSLSCSSSPQGDDTVDPYLNLEPIKNSEVMAWVQKHNAKSSNRLALDPRYPQVASDIRAIITADDRIPTPEIQNGMLRNFWQDRSHVRGIWRQTTFKEFEKKEPVWNTLLDLDALNRIEQKSWVFHGANCLAPEYNLCLLSLSDAGKDEVEVREFDVSKKSFVDSGFKIPVAKTEVSWFDANQILVASNLGQDASTTSGYARFVKLWKRGTALDSAETIFEGKKEDVAVYGYRNIRPESNFIFLEEEISTFEAMTYLYQLGGKIDPLPFPATSSFKGTFKGFVFAKLRQDWKTPKRTFLAGSLVSFPLSAMGKKNELEKVQLVFTPDAHSAFSSLSMSKNALYLDILRDVHGEIYKVTHNPVRSMTTWHLKRIPFPDQGTTYIAESDAFDDRLFINYQTFTTPPSLYLDSKKIKTISAKYDASKVTFEQFQSTSADGTKIPYYVVHPKNMNLDGKNPTLLYAYGGFEVSMTPFYAGAMGKVWLEKGGVYVLANIRGGGEFGPRWHEAALKENRQRAYEDFASVAQDLFTRKITSPDELGIQGGSNGGLLMGVEFTQHPDYYKAVICESALLDMIRYTKLPPGASWIGEYGDPEDPKMAAVISRYSPYQNIKPNVKYPEVFFHTSTADDRVQPGHTRKVVARLEEYGNPTLLYENTEGGHGGAADLEQKVKKGALEYVYLYQKLMSP